jgi:hypothetical protein
MTRVYSTETFARYMLGQSWFDQVGARTSWLKGPPTSSAASFIAALKPWDERNPGKPGQKKRALARKRDH